MTQTLDAVANPAVVYVGQIDQSVKPTHSSLDLPFSKLSPQENESNEAPISALGTLSDSRYRLINAIPIDVTFEDNSFIVSWRGTEEFGFGDSVVEAIRDLQLTLIELFEVLSETADSELSDYLIDKRNELKRHIAVA